MSTAIDELKKAISLLSSTKSIPNYGKNLIFLGAPGTGKSTAADIEAKSLVNNPNDYIIRTVFHPASDYSTFVGGYKPVTKDTPSTIVLVTPFAPQGANAQITSQKPNWYTIDAPLFGTATSPTQAPIETSHIEYEFEPQAFLLAYMKAKEFPAENVVLIIEEINRANCAQVFGDIFQLLDRNYRISPNSAIVDYLIKEGEKKGNARLFIDADNKISLPSNLFLFATMNTSDQSLFPMDSAFIRRWERKYVKIDYDAIVKDNTGTNRWKLSDIKIKYFNDALVKIDSSDYSEKAPSWDVFLKAINYHISKASQSEDKMIGEFFVKLPDTAGNPEISEDVFVNSVMSYLWDEVCKDLPPKSRFFKFYVDSNGTKVPREFKYCDYFELDEDKKRSLLIARFIKYIIESYKEDIKGNGTLFDVINAAASSLSSQPSNPVQPAPAPNTATAAMPTTSTPQQPTASGNVI